MCVCVCVSCLSVFVSSSFSSIHVLKIRQVLNLPKSGIVVREKPFTMNFLAASCCYFLEMAMGTSKCIESRRRGSFALAFFCVVA